MSVGQYMGLSILLLILAGLYYITYLLKNSYEENEATKEKKPMQQDEDSTLDAFDLENAFEYHLDELKCNQTVLRIRREDKVEAVLLSIDAYEHMYQAAEFLKKHDAIERVNVPAEKSS